MKKDKFIFPYTPRGMQWVKPYVGPFTKKLATEISAELRMSDIIQDSVIVRIGSKKNEYDVLILFTKFEL